MVVGNSEVTQFPVYSWDTLIPILGTNSTPPLTPPLSAPPALSPAFEEPAADDDDDVFESDPTEQEDLPDDPIVSDTNNNSNNANNNGSASGKRRTQSLSALQNLQNNKEPESPLQKVKYCYFPKVSMSFYRVIFF